MLVPPAFRRAGTKLHGTLHLPEAGKLTPQTPVAGNVCAAATDRLFVTDKYSKRLFLIDTGSDLCVYPRKFNPAQQKYSAYDRELLVVYATVKHFRHMLEARHFTIFTDHKPITFVFRQKRDSCSPRQFSQLDFIAQFTTDIRHISGQDNVVADALSRVESVTAPPSYDEIAAGQDNNDDLRTLLASSTALRLERLQVPGTAVSLYCDISTGKPRPYIPTPLRLRVFRSIHDLSHPGTKATAQLVAQRFVWPGIHKDCAWARACQSCQRAKSPATRSRPWAISNYHLLVSFMSIST
jgi:hypothetical protein